MADLLTTLTTAKVVLGLEELDTSQDQLLTHYIAAVSAEVAQRCQRHFGMAEYTVQLPGSGTAILQLPEYPVTAAVVDGLIGFSLVPDTGELQRTDGLCWLRQQEYAVTFTAGYVLPGKENPTLPSDLELAVCEWIAIKMNMRGSEHLKTEILGPLRSDFLTDLPDSIQSVLDRYTKVSV